MTKHTVISEKPITKKGHTYVQWSIALLGELQNNKFKTSSLLKVNTIADLGVRFKASSSK